MNSPQIPYKSPQQLDQTVPLVSRVRHELRLRNTLVMQTQQITPNMVRITLSGPELQGFTSLSPDDHVKLFIPAGASDAACKRDYTPRAYNAQTNELILDFVIHEAGPATQWASTAQPGDCLQIGGPRGSQVISDQVQRWLLIGDESALPAITRRIEELPATAEVTSLVVVPSSEDQQWVNSEAQWQPLWLLRNSSVSDADAIIHQLAEVNILPETFVWLAGESGMVKQVREHLLVDRAHSKVWLKAAGYWKKGSAEASEEFD